MGRVSHDLHHAPKAAEYYLKAIDSGAGSGDYALLGRIHSNLGMLYTLQGAYDLALSQMERALHYFEQSGDSVNQSSVLHVMGRNYHVIDSLNLALQFYRKALDYAGRDRRPSILSEMSNVHISLEEYDKAEPLMREYLQLVQTPSEQACTILGRLLASTGQNDSARYYLRKSIDSRQLTTKAAAYYHLFHIAGKEKRWQEYSRLHEVYDSLSDLVHSQTKTETMQRMQRLYDYRQMENEANQARINHIKAKNHNMLIIAVAVLIIGGLTGCWIHLRGRREKHRKVLSRSFREISKRLHIGNLKEMMDTIRQIKELIDTIKKETKGDASDLFEINVLEQILQFLEKKIKEKEEKTKCLTSNHLYNLFVDDIVKVTDEQNQQLMSLIDEIDPSFQFSIRKRYQSISKEDLLLCYLIKIQLTGKRTSQILDISATALSMRRVRLAERMLGAGATTDDLDNFIASI
jgi:tetratricopeptide (TPR) repeat protein